MRIAVTGASGLIGTELAKALTADGHVVVRIGRSSTPGPDAVRWDPDAGTIDRAGLEGLEAVVHLAGEGIGNARWTTEHKRRILESRTKGTALLAETLAGLDAKPRVLVSGSAVGIYGDRGDEVLPETSPPGRLFLSEVCTAWEAAAAPAGEAGIRVAYARTGIVLSGGGGALKPLLRLFKLGLGGRLGDGAQWMSWISMDDEVAALRYLVDHDVSGPVNLTAPTPVTNVDFTRALGAALHRPAIVPVPKFGPRLVLGRELADELLFASQRAEPRVLESAGFTFRHPDLAGALAAIL